MIRDHNVRVRRIVRGFYTIEISRGGAHRHDFTVKGQRGLYFLMTPGPPWDRGPIQVSDAPTIALTVAAAEAYVERVCTTGPRP